MPSLAKNKEAYHHYAVEEEFEAGIALLGAEVKSAKLGGANLRGSYATIRGGELWLVNAHIAPYRHAANANYVPDRDRRLLMKKHELISLVGKLGGAGLTLVPLGLYTKAGLIKVSLGLARGKKKADKRATIKRRDVDRRIRQALRR